MDTPSLTTPGGTPVWISGAGPTVVLIHGVLMDHRMWRPQVEALSHWYRVCCFDMLGHGQAPQPPGSRSLSDFVSQAREVVETCGGDSPVLGGFSMGGLIAQAYGAKYSDSLSGLIILNAVYDRTDAEKAIVRARYKAMEEGGVESALASANDRWFTADERKHQASTVNDILGWIKHGTFAEKRKAHRVFSQGDEEVTGTLGGIRCPTLVMTGSDDAGSKPRMAHDIAAAIDGAECAILEGQRHMMTVMDAERVNARILRFLASLGQAA